MTTTTLLARILNDSATDADVLSLWRLNALRLGDGLMTEPTLPEQLATVRSGFRAAAEAADLSDADPDAPVDHTGIALAWGQVAYEAQTADADAEACPGCGCHEDDVYPDTRCDCECHDDPTELTW